MLLNVPINRPPQLQTHIFTQNTRTIMHAYMPACIQTQDFSGPVILACTKQNSVRNISLPGENP